MTIYHYYGTALTAARNQSMEVDGILTCEEPITTMEEYREAKQLILGDLIERGYPILIVKALSKLEEV
jgi:hypothetical protein